MAKSRKQTEPKTQAKYPCGEAHTSGNSTGKRRKIEVRRVDQCDNLHELFSHCLPAFGGAGLRRVYSILDQAIGAGCPLTVAFAGPVTVSGQHLTWMIPLLETGWVAYLSTTDAVCYHDGHRCLDEFKSGPFHEVSIHSNDGLLRDEKTIRVTDVAFDEEVLIQQDRFITACLSRPEFQKRMTGTELRYLLGAMYDAQEQKNGVATGLLASCHRLAIPIFVGAPSDGSVFLNSMKLWAMEKAGLIDQHAFQLDLHAEVFEACAYHYWGLFDEPSKSLATLILGGGVPKNFNLQPEPGLGQVLGLPNIQGYTFDVQIVTAPVTDGSLSSCPPAEGVTWGKIDRDSYEQSTESIQADYSMLMPFVVRALLENRLRYQRWAEKMGEEALYREHPRAKGYLRPHAGYRLFSKREELCTRLVEAVRNNKEWLFETLQYPLAAVNRKHSRKRD